MNTHMYTLTYVCMYALMHTRIYIYIYTIQGYLSAQKKKRHKNQSYQSKFREDATK